MRLLGKAFLVFAVLSLFIFIQLDPEDKQWNSRENLSLQGNSDDQINFWIEDESDLFFSLSSDHRIDVIITCTDNGEEVFRQDNTDSVSMERFIENRGDHTIRFRNPGNQDAFIEYYVFYSYQEDDGPRPVCGISIFIFLILALIFRKEKKPKGTTVIPAYMTQPTSTTTSPSTGSPPHSRPPQSAASPTDPFAPPPGHPNASITNPASIGQSPQTSQFSTGDGTDGTPGGTEPSEAIAYLDTSPPDANSHDFQFICPDCSTTIYIDRKIKKVKCPKCSHTFRIQNPRGRR